MEVKSSLIVSRPHARENIRNVNRKVKSVEKIEVVDSEESVVSFSIDSIGKDFDNLHRDDLSGLSYGSKKALSKFEQFEKEEQKEQLKSFFEFKVVV
ncbi:MAG: hypothetical protein HWE27_15895 [Gammaproteobacteria bacterium]|nr:hypothetical protein [Gammaproteobacteria bacterium]